ncbi:MULTISPECIES: hypothetical protein [Pseudomonas]|jgi:hypothetical protein|uniref:hypothetical protein n=1 Tax=Pseudomonas TaxID=286 RepID=UPI00054C0E72|nr:MULTISPECIES: hypothetical protein [Pseudomonas]PHN42390.1 hypothetical protein AO259_13675 [Pseudomonas sp. ICMP 564]
MRTSWLWLICCALFPLNSWAQLGIGDFTLGMPRQQVMDILHRHFPSVELEHNLSYPVPMPYYRAREPSRPYLLKDVPIHTVAAYFDEADRLKQLSINFDITDPERIKALIPLMHEARLAPDTQGRHELFNSDGELTYYVSQPYGWTVVEIADRAASKVNIPMRAHVDQQVRAFK